MSCIADVTLDVGRDKISSWLGLLPGTITGITPLLLVVIAKLVGHNAVPSANVENHADVSLVHTDKVPGCLMESCANVMSKRSIVKYIGLMVVYKYIGTILIFSGFVDVAGNFECRLRLLKSQHCVCHY